MGEFNAGLPHFGDGLLLSCYFRRVAGWPTGGESLPCVQLPPSVPPASLSFETHDGLTISWTPPAFTDNAPIEGYTLTVMREDSGGPSVYDRQHVSPGERSLDIKGLPVGRYAIGLWAESRHGSGVPHSVLGLPFIPSPVSVTATEIDSTSFRVSWSPVPGATFYECGYLTGQNTWLEGPGTADTSCELWWDSRRVAPGVGLVAGTTYTVGVKACQSALVNCTDWTTATASTQVLAAAPASYPLSAKEVGDTSFTLSWDPPAADAYYDLRVVTGLSRKFRVAGRTRDVTVPSLQPNTDYTVKVRTCQGAGGNCSSWVTIPVSTRRAN